MTCDLGQDRFEVSLRAPINIALIKYWGKKEVEDIIPCNASLSITLDSTKIGTTTTLYTDPSVTAHSLTINNKEYPITLRIQKVISKVLRSFSFSCDKIYFRRENLHPLFMQNILNFLCPLKMHIFG